jgi:hypothetical protein
MMETLVWGWEHMPKSLIFEKMLDLALPVVKSYRSDFYHDAKWLDSLPEESTEFFFTVRESGTWIATTNDFNIEGGTTFRITIRRAEHNRWEFGAEAV